MSFMSVMSGKESGVNVQVDSVIKQRKEKNMKVMETLVETVILCGQQNCALRGHRDDEKHESEDSTNAGNFRAFLQYRVNGGDTVLEEHLKSAPKNATYKSKTIQNELVQIIGDYIQKKIVQDINESGGYFSVSADEVRDTSNKEQLAVTLRFLDLSGKIMLGFNRSTVW